MSLEILQSIEQAEAKADGMRAEAQKQAREILKSVEAACLAQERAAAIEHRALYEHLYHKPSLDVDELYQQLMEQDRVRVAGELAKKSQSYAAERANLCKAAEARLEQAATQIFERIVRHGHS